MKEPGFERIAIVGLGLMGGSMALALKEQPNVSVLGIDSDPATRTLAYGRGIETSHTLESVAQADLIVLATPVRVILDQLGTVGQWARPGAIVMDLGSTKREIVAKMQTLPPHVTPIGGHPMCGKEKAGFAAADPSLYRDVPFVLTPLHRTSDADLARAERFVKGLGSQTLVLDAQRHDKIVAAVSHLPYVLATALMDLALHLSESERAVFEIASSGFRDTSRLAASDTRMMLDTLMTNRDEIVRLIRNLQSDLATLADLIDEGNEERLAALLTTTSTKRQELFIK